MGERRQERTAYTVLCEGERNEAIAEENQVQRPRSVFFQIIFCGRGLDKLTVIYHTKIPIVKKSSF